MLQNFFPNILLKFNLLLPVLLFNPIASAIDLNNQDDKISYSLGFITAERIKTQLTSGVKINTEIFIQGAKDNLNNRSALDPQQIVEIISSLKEFQDKQASNSSKLGATEAPTAKSKNPNANPNPDPLTSPGTNMSVDPKNNAASPTDPLNQNPPPSSTADPVVGKASLEQVFLLQNKKEPGVVELSSGLQYKIVNPGDQSANSPTIKDQVKVNYRGTLVDGTEFDSSYKRAEPTVFALNAVIKGWQEALMLMKPKATWKIFLPAKLAYGAEGVPGTVIGPNTLLIFDLELLEVNPK